VGLEGLEALRRRLVELPALPARPRLWGEATRVDGTSATNT